MLKNGWYKIDGQSAMAKVTDDQVTCINFVRPYRSTDLTLIPHKIYTGNKVYFNKKYNKLVPLVTDEKVNQIDGLTYPMFAFMMFDDNATRLQDFLTNFMKINKQSAFYSDKIKTFQNLIHEIIRLLNEKYNTNYTIDGETSFLKLAYVDVFEKMINEKHFNVELFNYVIKLIWELYCNIKVCYEFDEWLTNESKFSSICTAVLELRLKELQSK